MIYSTTDSNRQRQLINEAATQTKVIKMIYEQIGTILYKLLDYNNLKVEEHNNPIEMVSMVLMIDCRKQKDKSMTLTDSWKPLNQ